jgi:hypothetical protein
MFALHRLFALHRPLAVLLALATALVSTGALQLREARASMEDERRVEEFLSRMGLIDLQIVQLEKILSATPEGPQQIKTARQLADLYAARLMQAADDQARYDEVLESIRALISRIPQANTTALEVMLLQADYSRGEAQLTKWIEDRSQTAAREDAEQILSKIAPVLFSHQEELNSQLDKLLIQIDKTDDDVEREKLEQERKRLAEVAYRATFFAGWSNYFWGIAGYGKPEAAARFEPAKAAFRRFLSLNPDEKYEEVEVSWLGLESAYRARSLIGLAQSEVATGNLADAQILFKLLDDVSAPPALRDQAPMFYVQALLNVDKFAEAMEYARAQIDTFLGRPTQGKVSLCIALVRTGFTGGAALKSMGDLGVRGLAKLGEIGLAHEVLKKHGVDIGEADDFYLLWLKGHALFAEAEKTKSADDYKTAAETLQKALAHEDALMDVVSAGLCRYTLGWSLYQQKLYETAAEQFQQAATALKSAAASGGDAAVQSAWMAFAAYYSLAQKERRFVSPAIEALEAVKRDFPNSEQAKKVDFFIAKLRQMAGSVDETIEALSAIMPGAPNYVSARYDLCRVYFEQWQATRGTEKEAEWAGQLERAADTYERAARNDGNVERKLKVVLWTADVALNSSTPDLSKAAGLLTKAESYVSALPASSSAVADYHYKRLQLAQKQSDQNRVREEADWLAKNAAGSVYELSALVALASAADAAVKNASAPERQAPDRQAVLEQAAEIYRRLAPLVGETPKIIAEVKNARVVNARLAQYDDELENYRQAAERAERLLAAFPDDRDYLRLAGLASYHAGDYEAAVKHLRPLVEGLPKDSAPWHEAKYYQLAALAHVDKSAASEVYKQFLLLYPTADTEPWLTDREGLRRILTN